MIGASPHPAILAVDVHVLGGGHVSDPVEAYFAQLRDIRESGAGVAETTYYPAVKSLLDEVGGS